MDQKEWDEAVELLDHYLTMEVTGPKVRRQDVLLLDDERRVRLTGLKTDTVLAWSQTFAKSMEARNDIRQPLATTFLAGFDLALRVVDERMSPTGIPGMPLLDGSNRKTRGA